jgi:succinyl-CoA synthetase beta subunit
MEGTTEVLSQVEDWARVNRNLQMSTTLIFDMRDKIPNEEYFVDLKVDTSGEKKIFMRKH